MNSIKNSTKFDSIVKELASSLFRKKLKEITTTGNIAGYDSPMAFTGKTKKSKKKKKKIATNSTGYDVVSEDIDKKDERTIRKIVRKVVGNIFRDLWIKRSVWRNPSSKEDSSSFVNNYF